MQAREYLQRQLAIARRVCDAALGEVTTDQFNWTPPGTGNSIGATMIHLVAAEDRFIQALLRAKPMIWQTERWSEKISLTVLPGYGQGWDEVKHSSLKVEPVLAYRDSVRTATDHYLADLTADEFDRQIDLMGSQRPVADALAIMVVHIVTHAGEIAALKGIQGLKGLPF